MAVTGRLPASFWAAALATLLSRDLGCTAFSAASSAASAVETFWDDEASVAALPDPPSSERLRLLQSKPYRGGFEPARDVDKPYAPEIVYGSIPSDLCGSLATNGPGRIRVGDTQYGHWFDGDGYVTLLSLDGRTGKATFNGRFVRTDRYKAQEELMKMLRAKKDMDALAKPPLAFSGAWTSGGRGRWYENILRFPTNPANTATMWLPSSGDPGKSPRLYALCEGGNPIELDPMTLETIQGERPFASADRRAKVGSFFSAHFKRCPVSGDIYNHGYLIRPGPLQKEINVMKLAPDGTLIEQARSPLPFDAFVHDSALSSKYIIFFLPPYFVPDDSLSSLLTGSKPLGSLLEWHEDRSCFVQVHSRDDLKLKWRIELPYLMSMYHVVDAHDGETNDDGTITLKVRVAEHEPFDRPALERQFGDQYRVEGQRITALLKEFTFQLDMDGTSSLEHVRDVADGAALCEYPAVNTAFQPNNRRRYCWTNAASDPSNPSIDWLDGIQVVDMKQGFVSDVKEFGRGSYAGAPAFVPREGGTAEDDGYLLATVYRSAEHRSDVVVMDSSTLETLCVMELRNHVPYQFHGEWCPDFIPT